MKVEQLKNQKAGFARHPGHTMQYPSYPQQSKPLGFGVHVLKSEDDTFSNKKYLKSTRTLKHSIL
jgi:hypothetical protein